MKLGLDRGHYLRIGAQVMAFMVSNDCYLNLLYPSANQT